MALVTFSDATDIEAADLNTNFQDEDGAAVGAFGQNPQQNLRLEVLDLVDTTPLGERSIIIRPSTYLRVFDQQLYVDDTTTTPGDLTCKLECLTDSRLLGGTPPEQVVASGQTTPYELALTSFLENNQKILVPGFEYRLSLESDSSTATDYAALELVTYAIRGTS